MRSLLHRAVMLVLILVLPVGSAAASLAGVAHPANVVAVLVWLSGLGWGFHAMLRHRLAAEDQLIRIKSDLDLERDAHASEKRYLRERLQALNDEWHRFQDCLADGDRNQLREPMQAVQHAIARLQQRTL